MAKPSSITQELVDEIAAALFLKGVNPSINVVQSELRNKHGSPGSTAVVSRLLEVWKTNAATIISNKMMNSPLSQIDLLASELASTAIQKANFEFEIKKNSMLLDAENISKKHQNDIFNLNKEIDTLKQEIKENSASTLLLECSLLEKSLEVSRLNSTVDSLNSSEKELSKQIEKLEKELEISVSSALQVKAEFTQNIELINAQHASALSDIDAKNASAMMHELNSHSQKLQSVQHENQTKISELMASHVAERNRLLLEVDSLRTQFKQFQKHASETSASLSLELKSSKEIAQKLNLMNELSIQKIELLEKSNSRLNFQIECNQTLLSQLNQSIISIANSSNIQDVIIEATKNNKNNAELPPR